METFQLDPGETVLDQRVCNACIADAQMSEMANLVVSPVPFGETAVGSALDFVRSMAGGLWVGGRVVLTSRRLVFTPNALNRAMHKNLSAIAIPLSAITELRQRFGVGTQIADAVTASGTLTFRCFNLKTFLAAVETARSRAAQ